MFGMHQTQVQIFIRHYNKLAKTFCSNYLGKNIMAGGFGDYRGKHEPCIYCSGGKNAWHGGRDQHTIWNIDRERNYQHPTQKPVALAEKALNNSSKSGDSILDLFGGSGSTLIACEKTNRHARLMELDPKYCDVIVKRWEEFTGKKAVLLTNLTKVVN